MTEYQANGYLDVAAGIKSLNERQIDRVTLSTPTPEDIESIYDYVARIGEGTFAGQLARANVGVDVHVPPARSPKQALARQNSWTLFTPSRPEGY